MPATDFPVMVIGDDWRGQMAPFQSNITKIDKKFLEFFDEEPELFRVYMEDSVERVELKDGRMVSPLDPVFFQRPEGSKRAPRKEPKIPAGLRRRFIRLSDMYPTFKEFMVGYHNRPDPDPETGKYGYWWNPRSKWDFVNEEGRFKNFLRLWNRDYVWKSANGDIAWEDMKTEWLDEAAERWDKYEEEFMKGKGDKKFLRNVFGIRPDDDKTSFLQRRSYVSVYAVVYEGEWYQKGQNGWWGSPALPKDWEPQLERLIHSMPPETVISVVQVSPSQENEIS